MLSIEDAVKSGLRPLKKKDGSLQQRKTMYCFNCIVCGKEMWQLKSVLNRLTGRCFKCKYKPLLEPEKEPMFGTRYETVKRHTPNELWGLTSYVNREKWLSNHGYKPKWHNRSFYDLPSYIQDRWEDMSGEYYE